MKTYRAFLTDDTIIEGSFKSVYKSALLWARYEATSAKIYDAVEYDWCRLNGIPAVPVTTIASFKEDSLIIATSERTGNSVSYRICG